MNIQSLIGRSIIMTAITGGIAERIENMMFNYDKEIYPPIDSISIIMASYNEEKYIEYATKSVKDNIVEYITQLDNLGLDNLGLDNLGLDNLGTEYKNKIEFILVDSNSTDNTVNIAKKYVDKIISIPIRGKLTARNIATDISKGNIIVSTDADTYYPMGWLNSILRPFNDIKYLRGIGNYNGNEIIIGVNGSTFDYNVPWIPGQIHSIGHYIDKKLIHSSQMIGRNSAYLKHYFYLSGRFNENINQLDIIQMLNEEEKLFGKRLLKVNIGKLKGKIVFKLNAGCIHLGGKRIGCRLGTVNKSTCNDLKIGIERFG